jgi:hypothetical protein
LTTRLKCSFPYYTPALKRYGVKCGKSAKQNTGFYKGLDQRPEMHPPDKYRTDKDKALELMSYTNTASSTMSLKSKLRLYASLTAR